MTRSAHLRARLFSALGVAAIVPLTSSAETGGPTYSDTACLADNGDGVCPGPERAADAVHVAPGCTLVSIDGDPTLADGKCCYPVTLQCEADTGMDAYRSDCGCYGRPFVLEGRAVQAASVATAAWSRGPAPRLDGLGAADRARLATFWTANGLAEHSSVAGFARFVLDLCAHGAPADLVHRALLAGIEETHHARLCFALAGRYAGEPVGPGPLPMSGSAPVARSLVELAVTTAREGAIGETLSAFLAGEMLARATDRAVREVLETLVRDETRHAELAWATLRWGIAAGGEPVRAAVEAELARAAMRVEGEERVDPRLVGHGLVDADTLRAAVAEGLAEVVRPASAALLGRPDRAGAGLVA